LRKNLINSPKFKLDMSFKSVNLDSLTCIQKFEVLLQVAIGLGLKLFKQCLILNLNTTQTNFTLWKYCRCIVAAIVTLEVSQESQVERISYRDTMRVTMLHRRSSLFNVIISSITLDLHRWVYLSGMHRWWRYMCQPWSWSSSRPLTMSPSAQVEVGSKFNEMVGRCNLC
jgi:hypothetical protein